MNENPFSVGVQDSGAVSSAGNIIDLNLPSGNQRRKVWTFYQNDSHTAKGDEAWVVFYKDGQIITRLPALVFLSAVSSIAVAMSYNLFSAAGNSNNPDALYFNNSDTASYYTVNPFTLDLDTDRVVLMTNKGGTLRCLLACLSLGI